MNLPSLFLKLLNMSISAGWLVLVILVLRFALKKAPKWLTCSLWSLVALRLIIPNSIESIFSLIPSTQTIPQEILTQNRFEVNTGIPVINQHINHEILGSYYEGVTVPVDNGLNLVSEASIIWLIGMGLLLLYSLFSYLYLRRKVSASMKLRENIYLCDYIDTPFILGLLRPRIYLPSSLDEGNWSHVLAHEQAHLKRRDHWWKPLGFALLSVYWFNPLLWLAYVILCKDIELACDEKVIKELGNQEKAAYSQALLECSMPRYLIAACPLAFGEVGVKDRIKSILNYKRPAFWVILIALILCISAAVCFLTDPVTPQEVNFIGTVVGTYQGYITVEPAPDSNEAKSASQINVRLPENPPVIQNGDTVRITYGGEILESSPAQIISTTAIEVLTDLKYVTENYSLARAILEGYTVMIDGDVAANQVKMHNFFQKTGKGMAATLRYASYYTIGDPDRMSKELFESSRGSYPYLTYYELEYDGEAYTLRWYEGDTEYVQTWKYLLHFEGVPSNSWAPYQAYESYILADRNDVTYDELFNGMVSADFRDQIPYREIYFDKIYEHEPTLAELEQAMSNLEPQMVRYRIASLDVNQLTGRLDIQVYEWVDGLFDLIEQYVDPNFVTATELRGSLEFTAYNSIESAIADGCIASVNGDLVSGHNTLANFLDKTSQQLPASITLANLQTVSSPDGSDLVSFREMFQKTPSIYISRLVYDGSKYIRYSYSDGAVYAAVFKHLLHYANVSDNGVSYRDIYVLTDHADLSWEEYNQNRAVSATIYPHGYAWCRDIRYDNEPDQAALEKAKSDLTPYMQEYQITSLEVNPLTGRLDIRITDWIEGLDALVERFIGRPFVTITPDAGWNHLSQMNDLIARYPEYFSLNTYMGLNVHAFEDGYVLVSRADKNILDSEILKLPMVTAEEMAMILETYHGSHAVSVTDIRVINRSRRTEYDIRKELGIYPECNVTMDVVGTTSEGATLLFTIHNLDNKEVWAGPEFKLEIMTENGWQLYGHDPNDLAWDTALLFHKVGAGIDPLQTSFLTQEELRYEIDWSVVADTPLPAGNYRLTKTISICEDNEVRSVICYAFFTVR